jgi:hypothetical protein
MLRNNNMNSGNNRRNFQNSNRNNNTRSLLANNTSRINRISKQTNSDGTVRIRRNQQLLSIPSHNFQTKIQKSFRIYSQNLPSADPLVLTNQDVLDRVRSELGIATSTSGGEQFTIHSVNVYASGVSTGAGINVGVYNTEEAASTSANLMSLYEDFASSAGISSVSYMHPLSNRPTFNRSTTIADYLRIVIGNGRFVAVDVIGTYIRTSGVLPSILETPSESLSKST